MKTVTHVRHGLVMWRLRVRGRLRCLRFGMTASAWDGWTQQHFNPYVAMCYLFGSAGLANAAASYIITGVRGDDQMYYVVMISLVCLVALKTGLDCCLWRWGLAVVNHKLFRAVAVLAAICTLPKNYVGYLGPDATAPWHDRSHFMCVHAVFIFLYISRRVQLGLWQANTPQSLEPASWSPSVGLLSMH